MKKKWRCPICHSEKESEMNVIMNICGCGEAMVEVFENG